MSRYWNLVSNTMFGSGVCMAVAGLMTDVFVITVIGVWAVVIPVCRSVVVGSLPLTAKQATREQVAADNTRILGLTRVEQEYTPCTCRSKAPAVPVEVVYDVEKGPEVVAHLCPECRERRTPTQIRVETAQALDRARVMRAALALKPVTTENLDRDRAQALLWERNRLLDTLLADAEAEAHGSVMGEETARKITAITEECRTLKAWLDDHPPRAGLAVPHDAGATLGASVEPSPPLEIEQGGWVYSIGWHNADDLCDEDAHEWNSVSAHGSALPLRQFCDRCGVSRRLAVLSRWA